MQTKNIYEDYSFKRNHVFGRLTLTGETYFRNEKDGSRERMVVATCICGIIKDYVWDSVKRGHTKSCGCYKKDMLQAFPNAKTHGLKNHPLYRVWDGMKQRCYNPNHEGFEYWGGKGIIVCREWKDDFKAFFDWAITNGWRKGLTIERRKSSGNYEPDNCYFATYKAQRMNMEDIKLFSAWGEKKCAIDWSKDPRCKVTYGGLRNRLNRDKDKWPDIEKAISTPAILREDTQHEKLDLNRTMITAFGIEKSINEWLQDERCVANLKVVLNRRKKGWSGDRIVGTPVRAERTK